MRGMRILRTQSTRRQSGMGVHSSVSVRQGFSSSTIFSFSFTRTFLAATPRALAIALSFDEPWQMMQMPSMPSSGAPPNAL